MVASPSTSGNSVEYSANALSSSSTSRPLIDLPNALRKWGDEAPYQTYLQIFISTYGEAAKQLVQVLDAGDVPRAAALVHKVRGSSGALNLRDLAARAGELETALNHHQAHDEALQDFCQSADSTMLAIGRYLRPTARADDNDTVHDDVPDKVQIRVLLCELLQDLERDDLEHAQAIACHLGAKIKPSYVRPLHASLQEFDLQRASTDARELARTLEINLME
jgi:HPt (histidine-containing phosphotransfer) domain-containing protein